jgi:lysophospholipase L1-like esterase
MKKFLLITIIGSMFFSITLTSSTADSDPLKIVALGDSITYGLGDPLKKGYVGRFKDRYEGYKGSRVEVANFGIPRYTTNNLIELLKYERIRREINECDYIILYIGTNDFRRCASYQFDRLDLKKMDAGKEKFSKNLQRIFAKIRKENPSAPIIVMGLYHPYTDLKKGKQIRRVINGWNREIVRVAAHYEPVTYVATMDLFLNKPKKTCFSDSLHLNAYGYELVAERLFQKFVSLNHD